MRSDRRTRLASALAALALSLPVSSSCATVSAETSVASSDVHHDAVGPDDPVHAARAPARLPAPESSHEAQTYLSGALAALRANQPQHAALFLDAILGSDHLSDRGRANIYWLAADAHRMAGHDDGYVDALGGFLVAADLLPVDEELRRREVEARARLLARKVRRDPLLGKSPHAAIRVEDARDPSGVAAELGCVEQAVSTHGLTDAEDHQERRLEERRLLCEGEGRPVVLWFDVTPTPNH